MIKPVERSPDGTVMEIAAVGSLASAVAAAPAWRRDIAGAGRAGAGFDTALEQAMRPDAPVSAAGRAEALVGQQVTAPVGGCQCDAMAAAVAPQGTTWQPVARETVMAGGVEPGDLLLVGSDDPAERLHAAIVRNLTEMITTGAEGTIGVHPIPWGLVREVRRAG